MLLKSGKHNVGIIFNKLYNIIYNKLENITYVRTNSQVLIRLI